VRISTEANTGVLKYNPQNSSRDTAPAAVDRYLLPAGRSAANLRSAVAAVDRWNRQTYARTPDRYIDPIDVKKRFLTFFYFGHVFYVFDVFIFQTFFYLKNVGKVQSGKQINKKHFQNNTNEIHL